MANEQTQLDEKAREIAWDEASQYDMLDGKFFSPEQNIEYKLAFSSARLVRKMVKKFQSEELEERTVLEVLVSSINGQSPKTPQMWNVRNMKLRAMFEPYCRSGQVTKKTFLYKYKGQGKDATYTLATLD